jgi:NADH dehydrogenase
MPDQRPHVVIVGAGFGGLAAARALKKAPVRITLIDRSNHHLFQPLLYQVATSVLAPGNIASPIRGILRRQKNVAVVMQEVTHIDKYKRCVHVTNADSEAALIHYDYLILATGARHSYFGHDEFEKHAPGLKTLADAVAVRNKILRAFEVAETEGDPSRHKELLTFVLVGAGPTGVEIAGAIATLVRYTIRSEFRRIDPSWTRIILIHEGNRLLPTFAEGLSTAVHNRLKQLGVEVRLGDRVQHVDEQGVILKGGERIQSRVVIWAAGVVSSPAGKWIGANLDRTGRIQVEKDLTVPEHPEIFAIGDLASLEQDGHLLPGVAQVALQQGRYAAKMILSRLNGGRQPAPFRYHDKGSLAIVGPNFAVLQRGTFRLSGVLACLVWVWVHIQFLAQTSLRFTVFLQWMWTYFTGQRGSRLIVNHIGAEDAATPVNESVTL